MLLTLSLRASSYIVALYCTYLPSYTQHSHLHAETSPPAFPSTPFSLSLSSNPTSIQPKLKGLVYLVVRLFLSCSVALLVHSQPILYSFFPFSTPQSVAIHLSTLGIPP